MQNSAKLHAKSPISNHPKTNPQLLSPWHALCSNLDRPANGTQALTRMDPGTEGGIMELSWTLERMTAFLKHARVCLECGRKTIKGRCFKCVPATTADIAAIVEEDKATRWPMIQAELDAKAGR